MVMLFAFSYLKHFSWCFIPACLLHILLKFEHKPRYARGCDVLDMVFGGSLSICCTQTQPTWKPFRFYNFCLHSEISDNINNCLVVMRSFLTVDACNYLDNCSFGLF
ncbi:unnamed protein product [Ilex paraguariensis]|uniref:Secreted protein n=1 Tax=Ilex paraguariensis TaxID=185542 RepID=A0ABC8U4W1_9AQUA